MSSLFQRLKNLCSFSLRLRHFGSNGELLSENKATGAGRYSIRDLSKQMKVEREIQWIESPLSFQFSRKGRFEIRFPSQTKIKCEGQEVWAGKERSSLFEVSPRLEFSKVPNNLEINLPNGSRICFESIEQSFWLPTASAAVAIAVALVVGFHFGVAQLIFKSSQALAKEAQNRMQEIADLRNVEVSLIQPSAQKNNSQASSKKSAKVLSAEERNLKKMARLLNNWGVGKPIANANTVLEPSKKEDLLKKYYEAKESNGTLGSSEKGQWANDFEFEFNENSTPINIPAAEIAKALAPVIPRLQDCYDEVLIRDSSLKGNPKLYIDIDITGRVEYVEIQNLSSGKEGSIEKLRFCFNSAYRQIRMPTKPNQAFTVTRTIVLQQS